MKKMIITALFTSLATLAHAFSPVIHSDASSFVWKGEWEAAVASIETTREGEWNSISLPPFESSLDVSGAPQLPLYRFSIGVPVGEVSLSFNFTIPVTMRLALPLIPAPKLVNALPVYEMNAALYGNNPGAGIDTNFTMIGNQRVLNVVVRPATYSYGSSTITCYRGVTVDIRFNPSGRREPNAGYENILSNTLINYNQARDFRIGKPVAKVSVAKTASQYSAARTYRLTLRNSTSFGTEAEGMYRITGAELRNIAQFSSARIEDLRLYAPKNIVLRQIYTTGIEDSAAIRQIPIEVIDKNGNGYLDDSDEIRFFGRADTRFRTESATSIKYERNPFDTVSYYWLSVNSQLSDLPLRIDTASDPASSNRVVARKGYRIIHRERDEYNPSMNSYKDGEHYSNDWLWQNITAGTCYDNVNLPYDFADSVAEIFCPSGTGSTMQIKWNGDSCHFSGSSVYGIRNLGKNTDNTVTIKYTGDPRNTINLDYYQVRYFSKLDMISTQLLFFGLRGTDTLFDYKVYSTAPDSFICYDITDEYAPVRKRVAVVSDTLQFASFGRNSSAGGGGRFAVVSASVGWLTPYNISLSDTSYTSQLQVRVLRNTSLRKDYVIVAHPMFVTQALKLAKHRLDFAADSINTPVVVRTDDIYNHFSGGTVEPAAIRNFLMYAQKHWGTHTALLFGAGFRRYRVSVNPALVPVFIPFGSSEISRITNLSNSYSTCTDDYYMNGGGWRMKVGRFPVATESEAEAVVDKTIAFDLAKEDQKGWRNRVLLTADDDMQLSARDPVITGSFYHHMTGTEVSELVMPSVIERVKVYMQKYPRDPVSLEKPLAEYEVLETVNRGALLWYYVGHGASDLIASEKLFSLGSIKKLTNVGKTGLFWAASCNVGKFDDPSIDGLCVRLLTEPAVGTVASIGASRESSAIQNDSLMKKFTNALFNTGRVVSLGEAFQTAKIQHTSTNSSHYNLMGDPAVRLYPVSGAIVPDSGSIPDTMSVLGRYAISGRVPGMVSGGDVQFRLKEPDVSERISYATYSGGQASMSIVRSGRTIVSGASAVNNNGSFSLSMLVPKDAPVGMSGVDLYGFAANSGRYGTFVLEDVGISVYSGTGTVRGDGAGPQVRFYLSNNVPLSGSELVSSLPVNGIVSVNRNSAVTIEIEDIDGVRLNATGPSEALYYEIDGVPGRRYVESLKDVDGRVSSGYFSVRLSELFGTSTKIPLGDKVQLKVSVMDNFDNRTIAPLSMIFQNDSALGLNRAQVFPYPNPFSKETRIIWKTILPSDVTVNIYSQNGKKLRVLKSTAVTGSYDTGANSLWDGRDEKGNRLARGIYFYTVHVRGSVAGGTSNAPSEEVVRGAIIKD